MNNPDVLMVGAGPIGLWTAILMKANMPSLNVLMFEKYAEPKRNQVLHLDKTCFKGISKFPVLKKFVEDLAHTIKISELEKALTKLATDLGIVIQYNAVQNCKKELQEKYPSAKVIVGSDGTHSIVRKQFFSDAPVLSDLEQMAVVPEVSFICKKAKPVKPEPFAKQDLQYFALVNYKVKGKTRALSKWTELPRILLKCNHLFSEHVSKTVDNVTTVTMRAIIDKKTYTALRGMNDDEATAKKPLTFEKIGERSPEFSNTIAIWRNARLDTLNEKLVDEAPTVSTTILSIYSNKDVYKIKDKVLVLLAGEAYAAVPFFRSINMCLQAAEFSVKAIGIHTGLLLPAPSSLKSLNSEPQNVKECAEYIEAIFSWEARKAKLKNLGLQKMDMSVGVSRVGYQGSKKVLDTSSHASYSLLGGISSVFSGIFNIFKTGDSRKPASISSSYVKNYKR